MRTASDIERLFQNSLSRFRDRDQRYLNNHYAYLGEYDKLTGNYDYSDPLRDVRRRRETQLESWNLIKPMVDAHRVLIDRMPLIRVPAPKMGDPLAAAFADKQEKAYYALWDASKMKRQHGMGAHNIALYYSTVWFVRWDKELDHPVITSRRPSECYPVTKRNGQDLACCMFAWEEDAESLAENYPEVKGELGSAKGSPSIVNVIEYVDDTHYGIVINGTFVSLADKGKHDLGFVPVVITPGAYIPEAESVLFPPGPTDQLVNINCTVNKMQTKWMVAIERNLFPGVYISGENARDVVVNNGPGAVTVGEGDTKIGTMPSPDIPREMFVFLNQAQDFMRVAGNYPQSASGNVEGSIVTGKAINRLQGSMNGMAAESLDSIGDGLKECNRMMFKMLDQYRPDKKFFLYSSETFTTRSAPGRPNNFSLEMVPKEDIHGYYANECTYSPMGSDFATGMQTIMQAKQAGLVSARWGMNQMPGVEDAEGMQNEIEEEMRRRLTMEAEMQILVQQKIQEGQMQMQQQQADLAAQAQGGAAPAPGGAPPPGAPAGPGGAPPMGPGGTQQNAQMMGNTLVMPGGAPQMMGMGEPATGEEGFPMPYTGLKPFNQAMDQLFPGQQQGQPPQEGQPVNDLGPNAITLEEVKAALEAIGKLRGMVYIGGDIVKNGVTEGRVVLYITDKQDKGTITNAIQNTPLFGRIEFIPIAEGGQPPGTVPLSGGSSVQQEAPQATGGKYTGSPAKAKVPQGRPPAKAVVGGR